MRLEFSPVSRIIHRHGDEDFLQRLLEAICVSELLAPGRELWIVSAWMTDFLVLDNSKGVASGVAPEWPADKIRLTRWLAKIAEAGTQIRLMTNKDEKNDGLKEKIAALQRSFPDGRIQYRQSADLHEKGMVGDGFYLRGSFNFTQNGITQLAEQGQYDTDPEIVGLARIEFDAQWERSARREESE